MIVDHQKVKVLPLNHESVVKNKNQIFPSLVKDKVFMK